MNNNYIDNEDDDDDYDDYDHRHHQYHTYEYHHWNFLIPLLIALRKSKFDAHIFLLSVGARSVTNNFLVVDDVDDDFETLTSTRGDMNSKAVRKEKEGRKKQ